MGVCYSCGTSLDDAYFCFGCKEFICDDCDRNSECVGSHSVGCHLSEPYNDYDDGDAD